jgi:hypothetical protein
VIKDRWPSLKKKLTDTFGDLRRVGSTDTIALFLLNETPENAKLVPPVSSYPSPPYPSPPYPSPSYASPPRYDDSALVQRPIGLEQPTYRFTGSMPNVAIPRNLFTPQEIVPSREIVPFEKFDTPKFMPIELFQNNKLKEILASNGFNYEVGDTEDSKAFNYAMALQRGLIPELPDLLPKSEILKMSVYQLQNYLSDRKIVGSRGGDPLKQHDKSVLLLMYDRYASRELRGSSAFQSGTKGLSPDEPGKVQNIKTRFAIIDGEIQAGNNAPQLIRDARKLLKEMVTQKMVTLYEAQTHLKHLRKINKI